MTALDIYLANHYLTDAQLAAAGAIGIEEHDALIRARCVPAPSYVVTVARTLLSFLFGDLAAPGATPGRYFHPSQLAWIARARQAVADGGPDAAARLERQFCRNFGAALATLDRTTWRLADSFDDDGAPLAAGLQARTDSAWKYFLNGTFALCVADPVSEERIAHKEVLQEKLVQLSENGARTAYSPLQRASLHELINAYAAAAMPFSPVEYALSSRKRLVEDLRLKLGALPAR